LRSGELAPSKRLRTATTPPRLAVTNDGDDDDDDDDSVDATLDHEAEEATEVC